MGMYDEIVCNYPLPTQSPFAIYQTKSLDCVMATYEIAGNGRLMQTEAAFHKMDAPEFVPFTGVLEFYNSNACASAFGHVFISEGSDFESVTYEATFSNGEIVGSIIETEREQYPALTSEFYRQADIEIDKDAPQIDETEPEVGATLWRLWGGFDREPYPVALLAKTATQWALSDAKGSIEKEWPSQLGNILFCTEEDALAAKRWRKESWERKTQWCADRLAEKLTERKASDETKDNDAPQ